MTMDPRLAKIRRTANGELLNRAIRHGVFLQQYANHESATILKLLDREVLPEYLDKIEPALLGMKPKTWSSRRTTDLVRSVDGILRTGMRKAGSKLSKDLEELAQTESEWQVKTMREAVGVPLVRFREPNPAMLKALINDKPFEGEVMSEWWERATTRTQARIAKQINVGVAAGMSGPEIAKRIRGAAKGTDALGKGTVSVARNSAEAITRTAVGHVSSSARDELYLQNNDMIKGVRIVATLDGRTTPVCQSQDGKVYDVGSGPRPPFHWGCRTTTSPVLKSAKELGINFDDDAVPEARRAALGGDVPATTTYPEWLKQQPPEVQNRVLGPTRADLFRKGKVPIDRFVNEKGRLLSLDELRKQEGLAIPLKKVEAPAKAVPKGRPAVTKPAEAIRRTGSGQSVPAAKPVSQSSVRKKPIQQRLLGPANTEDDFKLLPTDLRAKTDELQRQMDKLDKSTKEYRLLRDKRNTILRNFKAKGGGTPPPPVIEKVIKPPPPPLPPAGTLPPELQSKVTELEARMLGLDKSSSAYKVLRDRRNTLLRNFRKTGVDKVVVPVVPKPVVPAVTPPVGVPTTVGPKLTKLELAELKILKRNIDMSGDWLDSSKSQIPAMQARLDALMYKSHGLQVPTAATAKPATKLVISATRGSIEDEPWEYTTQEVLDHVLAKGAPGFGAQRELIELRARMKELRRLKTLDDLAVDPEYLQLRSRVEHLAAAVSSPSDVPSDPQALAHRLMRARTRSRKLDADTLLVNDNALKARVDTATEWLAGHVEGDVLDRFAASTTHAASGTKMAGSSKSVAVAMTNDSRAFATTLSSEISLSQASNTKTIVHEMTHLLEIWGTVVDQDGVETPLSTIVQMYYARRTDGEKLTRLSHLLNDSNYGSSELTRPDKWLHPYAGKSYSPEFVRGRLGQQMVQPSEVLTMLVQEMYSDPLRLAQRDPHGFRFALAVMRGESKESLVELINLYKP